MPCADINFERRTRPSDSDGVVGAGVAGLGLDGASGFDCVRLAVGLGGRFAGAGGARLVGSGAGAASIFGAGSCTATGTAAAWRAWRLLSCRAASRARVEGGRGAADLPSAGRVRGSVSVDFFVMPGFYAQAAAATKPGRLRDMIGALQDSPRIGSPSWSAMEHGTEKPRTIGERTVRVLWFVAGATALVTGIVGIVVPLLPTTPFILLAAFCFARSSQRVEKWMLEHRRFGPIVRDWRERRAVPLRAKQLAITMMAIGCAIAWFALPPSFRWLPIAICSAVAIWLWQLPTR
jgi:uncharacterized protein